MLGFALFTLVLASCAEAPDPVCTSTSVDTWNESRNVVAGVTAPGRVHGTDFKFQHKGELLGDFECVPKRIWCPEPDNDKGCQVFTCSGTAAAGTVIRVTDVKQVSYYDFDRATQFRWNGQAMQCPGS